MRWWRDIIVIILILTSSTTYADCYFAVLLPIEKPAKGVYGTILWSLFAFLVEEARGRANFITNSTHVLGFLAVGVLPRNLLFAQDIYFLRDGLALSRVMHGVMPTYFFQFTKWYPLWRHIKEDEQQNNNEIHHDATTATPLAAPPLAGVLLAVLFNYLSVERGRRQVTWVGTMTHSDKGTKRNDLGRFDGNNKQQQ